MLLDRPISSGLHNHLSFSNKPNKDFVGARKEQFDGSHIKQKQLFQTSYILFATDQILPHSNKTDKASQISP